MDGLIVGASARAAAQSAVRAGLRAAAVDLFNDRDLAALVPCHRIEPNRYPDDFERLARALPPGPWLYTGALENHPELVDRMAAARPLWGNPGGVLRAVRDPFALADALARAGLPCPEVRPHPAGLPRDGSWLVKPLRSAGGRGIRPLADKGRIAEPGTDYLQRRIQGRPLAALFVAGPDAVDWIGTTEQWLGDAGDGPWCYRGSLGPVRLPARESDRVAALGRAIAAAFGLVGLFGIDFILNDGEPWPVEVNPRYTASAEVLELALGRRLLRDHARACDPSAAASLLPALAPRRRPRIVGKLIVFAERPCHFPDGWAPTAPFRPGAFPRRADLPMPGTRFDTGEPVLTLLDAGADLGTCRSRLERRARRWQDRLIDDPTPEGPG